MIGGIQTHNDLDRDVADNIRKIKCGLPLVVGQRPACPGRRQRGDLYIMQIIDEEMIPGDPRFIPDNVRTV